MSGDELLKLSPDTPQWQDYRSSNTGMVIFYGSDPVSDLPIREVPEEVHSEIIPEPNYETGTYGLYGCSKSKIRNAFVKTKLRYLIFVTKYAGNNAQYRDKLFVTGYYQISKTADVKKLHIRYSSDYSCIDEKECYALRASERRFVSIEDAFPVTDVIMKKWEYHSRITKQTRILLDESRTAEVIEYLKSKPDITDQYIAETTRLQPHAEEEEEVTE